MNDMALRDFGDVQEVFRKNGLELASSFHAHLVRLRIPIDVLRHNLDNSPEKSQRSQKSKYISAILIA